MSGHSKWSTIKRKKGANDAKRGKIFTQMAKQISLAAQDGADPEMNSKLKLAIQTAKNFNVPNDTIERAIQKGSGSKEGDAFEELTYEAYGPGGAALIIKTITDNKNRTVSDVKHLLSDGGGKMAQSGGVSWMFEERGIVEIDLQGKPADEAELAAIEAGAVDTKFEDETLVVQVERTSLASAMEALKKAGYAVVSGSMAFVPKDEFDISDDVKASLRSLIESLEESEDVNEIFTNVSI